MKSTWHMLIAAVSVCLNAFASPDAGVYGDWSLTLPFPDNKVGWLRLYEGDDGAPKASLMWRWTGPNELVGKKYRGEVAVDGTAVSIRYLSTHWINKPADQRWIELKGEVRGDEIAFIYTETDGTGKNTDGPGLVSGKRIPPPGPKPDISKIRYGYKIEMCDPAQWELRDPGSYNGWTFKDGVLSNRVKRDKDGKVVGKSSSLITKRRDFHDFQLIFDVRMPHPGANSGIYLRGNHEIQMLAKKGGRPGVNDMGALYGYIAPKHAVEKEIGEWQKMRIYFYKRHVTVVLNGVKIIDNEPVEGCTGGALSSDIFAPGPLWLQGDHTDVDYRNFLLVPILPEPLEVNVIPRPRVLGASVGSYVLQPGADFRGVLAAGATRDSSLPAEGYVLDVSQDAVRVRHADAAGLFYAAETVRQLAVDVNGTTVIPAVHVEDSPRFSHRGFMLDEARHFFGKQQVKTILDLMARYKMNRFHWHLSDDQGWRVESKRYPRLNTESTWRASSPLRGTDGVPDGQQYGPYMYTQEDLREIVAYAKERHIEIIPEIDMPGHVFAALAAYPAYCCKTNGFSGRGAWSRWGISNDVLCLGNPDAVKFAEGVLDEICEIFPGRYIHIGGDECPGVNWKDCEKCKRKMKELGCRTKAEYQGWFSARLARHLAAKGREVVGWDEVLDGSPPKSMIVQNWRSGDNDGSLRGAMAGHRMIMSNSHECYYTITAGLAEDPVEKRSWARNMKLTLERHYNFNPLKGIAEKHHHLVIGGEACAWTEATRNFSVLEWKMFPRLCAFAEALWLGGDGRDFADFERRAAFARRELIKGGVNCSPLR